MPPEALQAGCNRPAIQAAPAWKGRRAHFQGNGKQAGQWLLPPLPPGFREWFSFPSLPGNKLFNVPMRGPRKGAASRSIGAEVFRRDTGEKGAGDGLPFGTLGVAQ